MLTHKETQTKTVEEITSDARCILRASQKRKRKLKARAERNVKSLAGQIK